VVLFARFDLVAVLKRRFGFMSRSLLCASGALTAAAVIVAIGGCSHSKTAPWVATVASATEGPPQATLPDRPQINWVDSPQMATSLAQQFHLPILIFVTSDGCKYCRKMEREVWSNADIITTVETGFIPLKLNAQHNTGFVAAQQIRAFPTTLLFTEDATLITSATGYLQPNQLAGLLRSAQRPQVAAEKVTQNR